MTLKEIQVITARIQQVERESLGTPEDKLTADRLRLMLAVRALQVIAKEAYQHPLHHHILVAQTVLKAVA